MARTREDALGGGNKGYLKWQGKAAPYLFIAPFLLLFAVFGAYPIIKSLILSFYATNGPKDAVLVGTANFTFLFSDPDFWIAVKNTVVYTFFSIFLQLPIALGPALLLSQRWVKGREFWRLAFFSPNLMGQVFVGVLFAILFQTAVWDYQYRPSRVVWQLYSARYQMAVRPENGHASPGDYVYLDVRGFQYDLLPRRPTIGGQGFVRSVCGRRGESVAAVSAM